MAIELTHLLRVAQDAKHCMARDVIEGDRTHPFAQDAKQCSNNWKKKKGGLDERLKKKLKI